MKVLKTHLPKVINELLCEPTVDDVLDHMHRDLREIGVEDFCVFRFTYEGLVERARIEIAWARRGLQLIDELEASGGVWSGPGLV